MRSASKSYPTSAGPVRPTDESTSSSTSCRGRTRPFRNTLRHSHDVLGDRPGEDGGRICAPARGCGWEMRRFVVPEQPPDWSDRGALGHAHARPHGDRTPEWEAGAMSVPD